MSEIRYWKDVDTLDIELKKGKYRFSEEIAEGVILDISDRGDILAVEILNATERLTKPIAKKVVEHYTLTK